MQITPFKYCSGLVLVLMFFQLAQAKPSQRNHEKFDIKIEEKGTEFRQEVDIDDDDGIVTVHVPSHNDIDETIFITDTIKHLTMRVAPQQKMCFLTKNDPEELPPAAVWRKTKDSVQNSVITSSDLESKETIYEVIERLSDGERDELPKLMKNSCAQFPVAIMSPVEPSLTMNNTKFSKDESTIIDMPHRRKRHAGDGDTGFYLDECPRDKMKQKCLLRQHGCGYAYDRICDTHTDPQGRDSTQCNLNHWSGQVICCKPCCMDQVPAGPQAQRGCYLPRFVSRLEKKGTSSKL